MSIWGDVQRRGMGVAFRKEDAYIYQDIDHDKLVDMMRQGIVHFKYRKKAKKGQPWDSGEEREAWGTKKMDVIDRVPHGGDCPPKNAGYTIYFDMEKSDWRAFADVRLLGVCPHIFTQEEFNQFVDL